MLLFKKLNILDKLHEDVTEFLYNLHKFEAASRKVDILVGGNGCGYCHPENLHAYPNYY